MRSKKVILTGLLFLQFGFVVGSLQNNNSNKSSRSPDVIFLELKSKTNLNTLKINGVPLLHHCVQKNQHENVAALIRVDCDTTLLDCHGKSADYYAQDKKMKDIFLSAALRFYQDSMKGNNIIGSNSLYDK